GIRDFHVTGVQTCALPILQSNPILEIISALDYLKNYPYECTEQSSSKWFGLKMVQYIGKHYPAISDYFRTIKVKDTKSRLEENRSEERRVGKECRQQT